MKVVFFLEELGLQLSLENTRKVEIDINRVNEVAGKLENVAKQLRTIGAKVSA